MSIKQAEVISRLTRFLEVVGSNQGRPQPKLKSITLLQFKELV